MSLLQLFIQDRLKNLAGRSNNHIADKNQRSQNQLEGVSAYLRMLQPRHLNTVS
jgi:hypothetical protein